MNISIRTAALLALSTGLAAQSFPVRIGISSQNTFLTQQDDNCQIRHCNTALPPIGANATAAGGTAFDATSGQVYVSNGVLISRVDPTVCGESCAPQRLLQSRAIVTGLAVYEPSRILIATDSDNMIHLFPLKCPFGTAARTCSVRGIVPGNHTIGGVAVDDVTGTIYFSSSDFSNPQNPGNLLWVASISDPCRTTCMLRIPDCGPTRLVPIHGVAFDGCTNHVWVTDGFRQLALRVDTKNCTIGLDQCCSRGITDPLAGLCIAPSQGFLVGRSCLARPCTACPAPTHRVYNTPLLGNPDFALGGDGLPTGSLAGVIVGIGTCRNPGTPVPGLCGPIYARLTPQPILLGPMTAGGSAFCDGEVRFPLPIPPDPNLCNLVFCSQLIGLCPTANGTPGSYVPQARQWRIGWH